MAQHEAQAGALRERPDDVVGNLVAEAGAGASGGMAGRRPPGVPELQALLEAAEDSAGLVNADGTIVALSRKAAENLGAGPQELIGRCIYEVFPPEIAERRKAWHDQALRSGRAIRYRDRRGDRWFDTTVWPVLDEGGRAVRLAIFARDITTERRLAEALTQKEGYLDAVLSGISIILLAQDAEGVIRFAAGRGLAEAGLRPEELLGRRAAEVFPEVGELEARLDEALSGRTVSWVDSANGRTQEWRCAPWRDGSGQRVGTLGVVLDITEQSHAAEALRRKDIALTEVLAAVEQEKAAAGRKIADHVEKLIVPMLEQLGEGRPEREQKAVGVVLERLREMTSPFMGELTRHGAELSPTELRICDLIRRGLSSKEIARLEHVSPATVGKHREHIRRKLRLTNKGVNLAAYLQSLTAAGRRA